MKIIKEELRLETKGNLDLQDITPRLSRILAAAKLRQGQMLVFVVGSTAAVTTMEYEPGLIRDMDELYEKIAPQGKAYHHDQTWGDANGFSHLRAALTGPSLTIPFEHGKLLLGTWQQVVLAEFDHRPRSRRLIVQITGE